MHLDRMKYTEKYNPEHIYTFTGECAVCKKEQIIEVKGKELFLLRRGHYIQDAISNKEDEREFLMSGICGCCFDKMFELEEEDDA